MSTPRFEIIPRRQATPRLRRQDRRDWAPVIDALASGKIIFLGDDELSDQDVKYLQLAFQRRGKGERLSTQRAERHGLPGRQLELRA